MVGQEIKNNGEATASQSPTPMTMDGYLNVGGKEGERRKQMIENAVADAKLERLKLHVAETASKNEPSSESQTADEHNKEYVSLLEAKTAARDDARRKVEKEIAAEHAPGEMLRLADEKNIQRVEAEVKKIEEERGITAREAALSKRWAANEATTSLGLPNTVGQSTTGAPMASRQSPQRQLSPVDGIQVPQRQSRAVANNNGQKSAAQMPMASQGGMGKYSRAGEENVEKIGKWAVEKGLVPGVPKNAFKLDEMSRNSITGRTDSNRDSFAHGTDGLNSQQGSFNYGIEPAQPRNSRAKQPETDKTTKVEGIKKPIEVNWSIVFLSATFFDGLKILFIVMDSLGLIGAGTITNSVTSSLAGWILWSQLKSGGVQDPWKDIQGSFISGLIPYWNYIGQSWIVRGLRLRSKYNKLNAELKKKQETAMERLIEQINSGSDDFEIMPQTA